MIESTAVENTLRTAEVVRRARDLAITFAIALGVVPILYVANIIMLRGPGPILVSGYKLETTIVFFGTLLLVSRLILSAINLNRMLNDQQALLKSEVGQSAHVLLFKFVFGLSQ